MASILIISLIALVAFLLLTGFGIMRDFSRSWIRHSRKVFCRKQSINYYSELAVSLVVTLFIACAAIALKGAASILAAMVTTDDIAQFTTALRGTFSSHTTELQNPKNHILLFFINPALKMLAVLALISGIRLFFLRINKKAGGECYNEADVLYFGSLGVIFLIAIEILCHIQDVKIANTAGNIAYLLLDKFSYILFFLTFEETTMLQANKKQFGESINKYLVTNRIEKNLVLSGWKMIVFGYALALLLSLPYFLGLQWIRSNTALMSAFIIVLGVALFVMRKLFAEGWNLIGTVLFANSLSIPIGGMSLSNNKSRRLVFIGVIAMCTMLVAFGIAFPKQLFMLSSIMVVAICLMVFSIVVIYFLTMGISYLVAAIAKNDTASTPIEKCFAYLGWVLVSLPKAFAVPVTVVALAFMAMTCFPKELKTSDIFCNNSIVDAHGNWLYIDEEHEHYYAPVQYDEMPEFFKKALVAQEDRGFFQQGNLIPSSPSNWHGASLSVFKGRGAPTSMHSL